MADCYMEEVLLFVTRGTGSTAGWPWPHSVTCIYLHVGRR